MTAHTQAPSADQAPPRAARSRTRRLLSVGASIAIVVGVFWYFLPQFANITDVWSSIRAMTWVEIGVLLVAALWNLASYGLVLVPTMPGLTLGQAFVVTESSTAVSNTIPGGSAIGIGMSYGMYSSWGFSRSRATVSVLLSGIWNNFVKLGMPVLAIALLALQGTPSAGRLVAGLLGIAGLAGAIGVFALMLRSETTARRTGQVAAQIAAPLFRLLKKPAPTGWERATTKFRGRTILLLRARWHWLTAATLHSHASLFVLLLLSLRYAGVPAGTVGWVEVLAVFAFARLVTAIPITPGGLGLVEIALIAGLTAARARTGADVSSAPPTVREPRPRSAWRVSRSAWRTDLAWLLGGLGLLTLAGLAAASGIPRLELGPF